MKSAYELAMERLAASEGESKPLTDEQKGKLAAIDDKYRAKIAEREVFLNQKLAEAHRTGDRSAASDISKQLSLEKARLEEEREAEKNKVRG
ncbi:hypothetical protein [Pelagicoccus sp. SDUM812003]|uniref:hypothetical protein n=1 Tax=Pelagicoccus sp. SDUM812003 TaxID=3041267 RepID=UPI00280D2FD9|nr:hypothetical protein [Pelagicoccus sp. SDUM812003]MDQ8202658.1 hypothetical protein [Pelagicoccus sp. SDUM812003]